MKRRSVLLLVMMVLLVPFLPSVSAGFLSPSNSTVYLPLILKPAPTPTPSPGTLGFQYYLYPGTDVIGGNRALVQDSNGDLWFFAYVANATQTLNRFTPATGAVQVIDLPNSCCYPSIKLGPDGHPWLIAGGLLVHILADGSLTTFSAPNYSDLTFDAQGNLWVADTVLPGVRQITPDGTTVTTSPAPCGTGVRNLIATPDGAIWLNCTNSLFRRAPDGTLT